MKKQIFGSICLAVFTVFFASFVLIMGVLYSYFSSNQMKQLRAETELAARAVELLGEEYLYSVSDGDYRITYISSDGTVLFDNKTASSSMENHLQREEIRDAIQNGSGESSRYSTTLTERQLYYARKLSDNSILRLSATHLSWWVLIVSMLQPLIIVITVAIIFALLLAFRLSRRIVKPLNELNLEEPVSNHDYEEISPLLNRIAAQKKQLQLQEAELRRRKKEFETATDSMSEGILLLKETGTILSINKAAARILGISDYSVGTDLLLLNNTPEIHELLRISAEGSRAEASLPINGKNYQLNASPIITGGRVCGIALIIFDVTEKEKAETARREFTANVSHELKTPLQNIAGSAELLCGGLVKSEDVPHFAERIYSESKRMVTLIDDIIKLSHLDENAAPYDFESVDLLELANLTYRDLLPAAEAKHISFEVRGECAIITGIPQLISEIMYNLCDNAIKYNNDGGHVAIEIRQDETNAVLSVSDTGIGIPPEEQERIFERFYRVDKSRSKEVGGTGLGLSIVKHAALIHHAEMEVISKIGKGTEIRLIFSKEQYSHDI